MVSTKSAYSYGGISVKYKMKSVEVYAWQFNGKFDGTASFSFSEWTENFAPDRFKRKKDFGIGTQLGI